MAHPYLAGRLPNDTAVAAAVAADTTRWGLVHLAAGLASALVILAFLAIRDYLREAGDRGLGAVGVPFVAAQLYLHSAAAVVALWPLAHHMWRCPTPGAAARPGRARESHHRPTYGSPGV